MKLLLNKGEITNEQYYFITNKLDNKKINIKKPQRSNKNIFPITLTVDILKS